MFLALVFPPLWTVTVGSNSISFSQDFTFHGKARSALVLCVVPTRNLHFVWISASTIASLQSAPWAILNHSFQACSISPREHSQWAPTMNAQVNSWQRERDVNDLVSMVCVCTFVHRCMLSYSNACSIATLKPLSFGCLHSVQHHILFEWKNKHKARLWVRVWDVLPQH